jgi:hypothetical protein
MSKSDLGRELFFMLQVTQYHMVNKVDRQWGVDGQAHLAVPVMADQ